MTAIDRMQSFGLEPERRVTPALSDYSSASARWTEAEYRIEAEEGLLAGLWEGEPGWVEFESWPYREICVVLRGRVAIESLDGDERFEYGAGEAFTIPQGYAGRWVTLEKTRKVFVAVDTPGLLGSR